MAKVLSVEIGTSLIRLCEVDYKTKNPKVYKWATVKTPKGSVLDDVVIVNDELISAIRNVLHEKHMSAKKLVFTMNSTKIASRDVVIPFVRENKVGDVIKSNASDFFPVDLEQYDLGYSIIGTTENDRGVKQYKVHVLAAPKTITQSYKNLAKALGGTVEALDYCGNSLYQMVKGYCISGVQMVVKIDEKTSNIIILKDGAIALQRIISYGMEDTADRQADADTDVSPAAGQEEKKAALNYLISGILRVADYYNSHNSDSTIEQAYITGLLGNGTELDTMLSQALEAEVTIINEIAGIKIDKNLRGESFGPYIGCIGATISPLGFMPEKAENAKKMEVMPAEGNMQGLSVMILLGGILIAVVLALVSGIQLSSVRSENKRLNERITELTPVKQIYQAYLQQEYTTTKLRFFYDSTVVPNEELVAFIEEMEEKMPSSLNVQSFVADSEGVSMSLTVEDKKSAAKLIGQFRTFESISEVTVSGISDTGAVMKGEPMEQEGKVAFSISVTYKGADETQE